MPQGVPLPYTTIKTPKRYDAEDLRDLLGPKQLAKLQLRWAAKHHMGMTPLPMTQENIEAARELLEGSPVKLQQALLKANRALHTYAFIRRKPFLMWLKIQEEALKNGGAPPPPEADTPVKKREWVFTPKRQAALARANKKLAAQKRKKKAA